MISLPEMFIAPPPDLEKLPVSVNVFPALIFTVALANE
jgi:hypothetical protein